VKPPFDVDDYTSEAEAIKALFRAYDVKLCNGMLRELLSLRAKRRYAPRNAIMVDDGKIVEATEWCEDQGLGIDSIWPQFRLVLKPDVNSVYRPHTEPTGKTGLCFFRDTHAALFKLRWG
jgi:hypothetical protein